MPHPQDRCQVCSANELYEIPGFSHLPRVTSDSKPFRRGGRLFVCQGCGAVQKIADSQWLQEIAEIYRDYDMYHQSRSNDQPVFDPASGRPRGRCEVLARRLLDSSALAHTGRLLDVGAGSGAMLAAFSAASEHWTLFGLDLDKRKEPALKEIPRFEQLFTALDDVPAGQFDLVTLVHSLEHFTEPMSMLENLRSKLSPDGRLFVEVNNVDKMPFDLVVADHLCHFTPNSLAFLAGRTGLGAQSCRTDWVNKEISMLAGAGRCNTQPAHDDPRSMTATIEGCVDWLNRMLEHATGVAKTTLGIFGTSVAATWLANALGETVEFFVDEDPAREGREHMGRPIFRPDQVPSGAAVYLAFAPDAARAIHRRLADLPIRFAFPGE